MPVGSSIIIANRWQSYIEDFKKRPDSIINVEANYQNDVFGGILADIEQLISDHPKYKFYIISQSVYPSYNVQAWIKDMYNLELSSNYIKKLRHLIGCKNIATFIPTNISSVESINSRIKTFADEHENVYFIDRNIPLCKRKNECLIMYKDKPLFSDVGHLSVYGGEIVGKFILQNLR